MLRNKIFDEYHILIYQYLNIVIIMKNKFIFYMSSRVFLFIVCLLLLLLNYLTCKYLNNKIIILIKYATKKP